MTGITPPPDTATEQAADRVDEVRLVVPAEPGYAQVARLTVTTVAARIGFSYDEIEDLRIAVGEVCTVLVSSTPGARIELRCTVSDTEVTIDAERTPADGPVTLDRLSDQILHAVVDDVSVDPDRPRLSLCKRRQG